MPWPLAGQPAEISRPIFSMGIDRVVPSLAPKEHQASFAEPSSSEAWSSTTRSKSGLRKFSTTRLHHARKRRVLDALAFSFRSIVFGIVFFISGFFCSPFDTCFLQFFLFFFSGFLWTF